jgi:hypothetical protein
MVKASARPVSLVTSRRSLWTRVAIGTLGCLAAGCTPVSQADDSRQTGSADLQQPSAKASPAPGDLIAMGERREFGSIAITPLAVVDDSRCPQAGTCAWLGRVALSIAVERASRRSEHIVDSRYPTLIFGTVTVGLNRVEPLRTMDRLDIPATAYRFGLTVTEAQQ